MRVIKLLILFVFLSSAIRAQSPLDCKVSFNQEGSVEVVLKRLETSCSISFSYNSKSVPTDSLVSVSYNQTPIRVALKTLLGEEAIIKQIGSTVILKVPTKSAPTEEKRIKVRGVITDKKTNEVLRDVTVYSTEDLKPVLTDSAGAFEIEVSELDIQTLKVYKEDYLDTLIVVEPAGIEDSINLNISLKERLISRLDSIAAGLEDLKLFSWLENQDFQKHANNLGNFLVKNDNYQLSLIPGISTNGLMNSASEVNFSFNLFGGYTGAVNGVEVGGFVNLIKKELAGVQIGGFANAVGGKVNGVQIAGITNISLNEMNGAQISGFFNMAKGKTDGIQVAGFTNLSTQEQNGLQIAGFTNVCPKKVNATQISGFFNMGKEVNGMQITGFSNLAVNNANGSQISSFYNHVGGQLNGTQIGIINYAGKLKGVQMGIINIVPDSIKGVPIGLLSIAPKGYMRFQAEYSPTIPVKNSFVSGVRSFYNVLSLGAVDQDDFTFGYGVGGMIPLGKPLAINLQCVADQFTNNFQNIDVNINTRLSAGLHLRIKKRFELYGSYNLNFHSFKTGTSLGSDLYQNTSNGMNHEGFQDWSVGIRI